MSLLNFKSEFKHEPPVSQDLSHPPPHLDCPSNTIQDEITSRSLSPNCPLLEVSFSLNPVGMDFSTFDSSLIASQPSIPCPPSPCLPSPAAPSCTTNILAPSLNKEFCSTADDNKEGTIDDDPENGKKNNCSTPTKKAYDGILPCIGMEFVSLEEFERSYYTYAHSEGFTVRIKKTLKFDRSDEIRYRQYVCSCAGFLEEKKSNDEAYLEQEKACRRALSRRSGCPATITITKKLGVWKVKTINNQHNHLLVSPNSRTHLKKLGGMPAMAKKLVEKFSESDLPIGRVPDILNGDAGINVSQRDCWNHRRDLRKMNLDRGDADAVLRYCREKQAQDPNFFYSIQTDDDDRMEKFFWIDSTARQYYERFGDVLAFDTTYKTNKYSLPLANFVGVNNHSQSIMFGFALLQNEREETFVWLFETWLQAVGGKLPVSILTDQDHAIQNAIEKVFPTVTHRFCLWHIMKKFPEKYGSLYKENSPFSRDLKNCLYHSITVEQFESVWKDITKKYKLGDDEWLIHLFNIRKSWVPVYNRTIFYAGMNTTQRCESIHSFFDSFLNKGTTLREFVIKYEHALERRYMAEHEERFASIYKNPSLKVKSPIEEQAANVYSRNIFNQFQDELLESFKLRKEKLDKSGSWSKYKVSTFHNHHEAFTVTLDAELLDVSCQCHLFEFKGILCRHILAIFSKKDIAKIPPKYILPRWTKMAAEGIPIPLFRKDGDKSSIVCDLQFNNIISQMRPYLHVSTEIFDIIMKDLDVTLKKVSIFQESTKEKNNPDMAASKEKNNPDMTAAVENENEIQKPQLGNPPIIKTKGRKKGAVKETKNGRFRSGFEVGVENYKKQKRRCKNCGEYGHYTATCEKRKKPKIIEVASGSGEQQT